MNAVTEFDIRGHPDLPPNVLLVDTPGDTETRYWFEHGSGKGKRYATVTDREPDREDETVSHIAWEFEATENTNIFVHQATTIHRHGPHGSPELGEGKCETVPATEEQAADLAIELIGHILDGMVARPKSE